MPRPGVLPAVLAIGLAATARGAEPAGPESIELRFVEGLRDRGYFDLALEALERLRQAPDTPAELKADLDFEVGRSLLEEAATMPDLERRRQQLDLARGRLEAFAKAHPDHPRTPEALVQLARLLVERGYLARLQSDEAADTADRLAQLSQARDAFQQARKAYDRALDPLRKVFDAFPKFIPNDDPRHEARDRAHVSLMDAELQRAIVDYEEAHTHPLDSKPRNDLLDRAFHAFEGVYQAYRTQLAGIHARMLQGKCYEEKGELGQAMGIYNEVMDHPAHQLRDLQREVGYYRIIIMGKRDEHALAADEAVRWLQANPTQRRSKEGLGVQLELAKDLLAQAKKARGPDRDAAVRRATDLLAEVVRVFSPHKAEALALLKEYRPKAAAEAAIPANLSYEDALSQADVAIASQDWGLAIPLLKAAIARANPARKPEQANQARYLLAFCCYQDKRYYEADVLAEHLARRYPREGLAPKATEIGMAALVYAYNTYTRRDQAADLDRLIDLCRYTAATWPDTDPADTARTTLGEIFSGRGEYDEAARIFEAVRTGSSRRADALNKAGLVRWRHQLALRADGKAAEAEAKAKRAEVLLKSALKQRRDGGASSTDPGYLANACDLADVDLATDRAKEALALLKPMAEALRSTTGTLSPAATRLLATRLRAHVGMGKVDEALEDMKRLESAGGPGANLTQLYFDLGRLLEREMAALRVKGDEEGFDRTRAAYEKFLRALVASEAGQSYDSLQWAGESMLALAEAAEDQARDLHARRMVKQADAANASARDLAKGADEVFRRILETYAKDPAFQQDPAAKSRLLRTRIRQAAALRQRGEFGPAREAIDALVAENRGLIDPLIERGYLYEAEARADTGKWTQAYEHWRRVASALARSTPKPIAYYEATYHLALALEEMGKADDARRALKSVLLLAPKVGNPEMKARFEAMLSRLGG